MREKRTAGGRESPRETSLKLFFFFVSPFESDEKLVRELMICKLWRKHCNQVHLLRTSNTTRLKLRLAPK
jgi:hypothetical protein